MRPGQVQLFNGALGLIPDWQFSPDPRINSNLNPNVVSFPPNAAPMPGPFAGMQVRTISPPVNLGLPIIDSWWWQHRKAIVIGGGLVIVAAVAGTLSAVLR